MTQDEFISETMAQGYTLAEAREMLRDYIYETTGVK